ncbi:hypothetical protein FKG94_26555 [Exilibacterium tricleocarpae]|uniref:TssC1 N-terminal domain-containing protein n=1 Tax=Exilibacterium tricleocarpae TaxID=2591008 RepID=A0A545SPK6_9GAMM|nr:type VI secretion system contractile sheath large subunit [Exilibacterium tricleocarpae]TQV66918.1 hypothetical protein FKG94_26555 [Exilibacterium tricleocarpae]
MSRASISTGGIDFPLTENEPTQPQPTDPTTPMHLVVLGDFSGRRSRLAQGQSPATPKPIAVDKDNFDAVFAGLDVQLHLPVAEQPLQFAALDDLHPDFIYQRVGLFDKMRILKRKLSKTDKFAEAAAEITAWANYRDESADTAEPDLALPQNLLDAVLQQRDLDTQLAAAPGGDIDRLIKDIVRPFVETKTDPRQPQMLAAVDAATSDLMRKIMHHSEFQQLEASWRCLYLLVRRLELDSRLKLFLIDISRMEIQADLEAAETLSETRLYKLLVTQQLTPGSIPYSVLVGDYRIADTEADISLARAMAGIAGAANAAWLSGGHERLAGCDAIGTEADPDAWNYTPDAAVRDAWQQFCKLPEARHLALAAPRFMVRLPYGRRTSTLEHFDYEELSEQDEHGYYLWGNSAFLIALLLAQSYRQHGWALRPGQLQTIDNLPLHVHQHDGDTRVKPCAEVLLTDRAAQQLQQAGLLPIRSVKDADAVVVPQWCAVASDRAPVRGRWSD